MTWYSKDNIDAESQKEALPDGWYEATVFRTKLRESRAGNAMQQVMFKVYLDDGTERVVSDFYVDHANAIWKYARLASALNASQRFKDGSFDADEHTGDPLWLKLGQREDKPEYNEVVDVAKRGGGEVTRAIEGKDPGRIESDDIPF